MNKKSFLRGFGIGVLFTALVLGISCMVRTSDSAVVRRAKELGMEYGGSDEPLFQETEAASGGAVSDDGDGKDTPEETKKPGKKKKAAEQTAKPKTKKVDSPGQDDDVSDIEDAIDRMEKQAEESTRRLTIHSGEGSDAVSRKLEAMDIIPDAEEFDSYLQENGYSSQIRSGTFQIPDNATYEQIAKAITKK